jgi:hypothetical protein
MNAMQRRRNDDADLFDDDGKPYDKRFPGRRVVADGGRVRVPIMLSDAAPGSAQSLLEMRDARQRADDARQAYITRISDAWKTQPLGTGGEPITTAPEDDDEALSPRDQYIARLSGAYRTPIGQDGDGGAAADVEAQQRSWASPGARPGAAKDAAPDLDAYRGYVERITNGWKR